MHHDNEHQVWEYCVHLGPYSEGGRDYDLGVYVERKGCISLAAVYGNEDWHYKSGAILFNGEPLPFLERPIATEACRRFMGDEECKELLSQLAYKRFQIERMNDERQKNHM